MATVVSQLVNVIGFKVNKSQAQSVQKTFRDVVSNMQNIAARLTFSVTLPFTVMSAAAIKAAADVQETQNKFDQVFGSLRENAEDFATEFSTRLRRNEFQVKNNLASLQSFAVGMGFTREKSLGLSKQIQSMIIDFASFHNISDAEGFQRFIAGLSGSGEVFDRFGINIKENALKLELLTMGIAGSTKRATEMQKVLGRVSIIQKALGRQGAIGDAERTMREFTGAWKSAVAAVKIGLAIFGKELLPVATKVVNKFNDWFFTFKDKLTPAIKKFILLSALTAAALPPVVLAITLLVQAVLAAKAAFVVLQAAAIAANLPLALLIGKFILIGTAVAAVIGALALIVEDIVVFSLGGNSAIGVLIDRFDEWKGQISDIGIFVPQVFSDMASSISNSLSGLIEFITGVFMGQFRFAFEGLWQFLISGFEAVFNLIAIPFQAILDAFNLITGQKVTVGSFTDELSPQVAGVQGFGGGLSGVRTPQNTSNVNVNSNINLNFPVGTNQGVIDAADQQIRKAVRDELSTQIRNAVVANPTVE